MPRQNRVTPWGEIIATPARGTLMGNRGCLHDDSGGIVRSHRPGYNAWIYCVLEFKGRQRQIMAPGRYTELFFLDEATALAAGHRPCAECQRARYKEFMECWAEGNKALLGREKLRAPFVDAVLQKERMGPKGEKVKWRAKVGELPVGVMVELPEDKVAVVKQDGIREWKAEGYGGLLNYGGSVNVSVLTPRSVGNALRFEPFALK